jgi:hypothetical protein
MKSAWRGTMVDLAAANSGAIEEVDVTEFSYLLQVDNNVKGWEKEDEQLMFESDSD